MPVKKKMAMSAGHVFFSENDLYLGGEDEELV
jgi:hypothetical protein